MRAGPKDSSELEESQRSSPLEQPGKGNLLIGHDIQYLSLYLADRYVIDEVAVIVRLTSDAYSLVLRLSLFGTFASN